MDPIGRCGQVDARNSKARVGQGVCSVTEQIVQNHRVCRLLERVSNGFNEYGFSSAADLSD